MKIDNVNHPAHYEGNTSIECIDAMAIAFGVEAVISFCKCNAFKYVWRFKHKNGQEDLDKAMWYVNRANVLRGSIGIDYTDEQLDSIGALIERFNRENKKNP